MGGHVTWKRGILHANLQGIQAKFPAEHIDHTLYGEGDLGVAESPEGRSGGSIRIDQDAFVTHVLNAIQPVDTVRAQVDHAWSVFGVCAIVGNNPVRFGRDQAFFAHAHLEVDSHGHPWHGALELLLPCIFQSHGPPGFAGQQEANEVEFLLQLPPEGAADGRLDAMKPPNREVHGLRKDDPGPAWILKGGPEVESVTGVIVHNAGHWFQVGMDLEIGFKLVLKNEISFPKASVWISAHGHPVGGYVAVDRMDGHTPFHHGFLGMRIAG